MAAIGVDTNSFYYSPDLYLCQCERTFT